MNFKHHLLNLLTILAAALTCMLSCSKTPQETLPGNEDFNLNGIVKPAPFEIVSGGTIEIKFVGTNAPQVGDIAKLKSSDGGMHDCGKVSVSGSYFSFKLAGSVTTGTYKLYIQRGEVLKESVTLEITIKSSISVEPADGATIYGVVECNGKGVAGVVVSDGYEVVTTDKDGIYQLNSEKRHKYVFISHPGDYKLPKIGVIPVNYKHLKADASVQERVDFSLIRASHTDYKVLVFGDMHLANRGSGSNNDMAQYGIFVDDVNNWVSANSGSEIYAITLGDMSWDLYWNSKNYNLDSYIKDINRLNNVQVFNTIGNHDHEMEASGDFLTVEKYKKSVAPTYYSFNIGSVHYVVLDNIECTNDGTGNRTYNTNVVSEQIEWLKKDLSHVDVGTPVVVAMHAPLYTASGGNNMSSSSTLTSVLSKYSEVHFMTGHTHKMYNVKKGNIYEHNSGAVCATWWWSGKYVPGINISQDGTPGGYRVMDISGKNIRWIYKPTGKSDQVQFRSYDRNTIRLTPDRYLPQATSAAISKFNEYASDWTASSSDNYVYLNIWDWDSDCKLSVTENGKELQWTAVSMRDPLHLITYTAKCLDKSADTPSFPTSKTNHFFRVKASSADSTLEIKFTDSFGRTYSETMKRPKEFNETIYK